MGSGASKTNSNLNKKRQNIKNDIKKEPIIQPKLERIDSNQSENKELTHQEIHINTSTIDTHGIQNNISNLQAEIQDQQKAVTSENTIESDYEVQLVHLEPINLDKEAEQFTNNFLKKDFKFKTKENQIHKSQKNEIDINDEIENLLNLSCDFKSNQNERYNPFKEESKQNKNFALIETHGLESDRFKFDAKTNLNQKSYSETKNKYTECESEPDYGFENLPKKNREHSNRQERKNSFKLEPIDSRQNENKLQTGQAIVKDTLSLFKNDPNFVTDINLTDKNNQNFFIDSDNEFENNLNKKNNFENVTTLCVNKSSDLGKFSNIMDYYMSDLEGKKKPVSNNYVNNIIDIINDVPNKRHPNKLNPLNTDLNQKENNLPSDKDSVNDTNYFKSHEKDKRSEFKNKMEINKNYIDSNYEFKNSPIINRYEESIDLKEDNNKLKTSLATVQDAHNLLKNFSNLNKRNQTTHTYDQNFNDSNTKFENLKKNDSDDYNLSKTKKFVFNNDNYLNDILDKTKIVVDKCRKKKEESAKTGSNKKENNLPSDTDSLNDKNNQLKKFKKMEINNENKIDSDSGFEMEIEVWKKNIDELQSNTVLNNYALARKRTDFDNYEALVDYLSRGPFKNDTEKAWLIYVWITHNIEYDTEGFITGNRGNSDPESILKSGKTLCGGYTNLFADISKRLNMECKKISGYSKAFGYKIGDKIEKQDHGWNAIEIGGKSFYVESTWGAGNIKDDYTAVKQFNPYYFMVPPRIFVEKHFNESFQLQKHKLTLVEFEQFQKNSIEFHFLGLKCLTYDTCVINAQTNPIFIEYSSKKHIAFTSKLFSQETDKEIENAIFIQTEYDDLSGYYIYGFIVFIPEINHKYEFEIFGKLKSSDYSSLYPSLSVYLVVRNSKNILQANEIRPYNILLDHNLTCTSHKCALIESETNPIFIEFTSKLHMRFIAKLLSQTTRDESLNNVYIQTEYDDLSGYYSYGFIVFIPKIDYRYELQLFRKPKENTNQDMFKFLYKFLIIREKKYRLMSDEIRPYNLHFEFNICCLSHKCALIESHTNPIFIEYSSKERIFFKALLSSQLTEKKTETKIIQQTEYHNASCSYRYAFFVFVPEIESDYKYELQLWSKTKNDDSLFDKLISRSLIIIEDTKRLKISNIRPYNLLLENDITCLSHNCALIEFKTNPLTMKFKQPASILTMFKLKNNTGVEIENSILLQDDIDDANKSDGLTDIKSILISVPTKNKMFTLNVYAQNKSVQTNSYPLVYSFHLVRNGSDDNDNMKLVSLHKNNFKVHIFYPVSQFIESSQLQKFKCFIKDAKKVAIVDSGQKWHYFDRFSSTNLNDIWTIDKTIDVLGGLTLYAGFDSGNSFKSVCQYTIT